MPNSNTTLQRRGRVLGLGDVSCRRPWLPATAGRTEVAVRAQHPQGMLALLWSAMAAASHPLSLGWPTGKRHCQQGQPQPPHSG